MDAFWNRVRAGGRERASERRKEGKEKAGE
jgi:hypothetical protein